MWDLDSYYVVNKKAREYWQLFLREVSSSFIICSIITAFNFLLSCLLIAVKAIASNVFNALNRTDINEYSENAVNLMRLLTFFKFPVLLLVSMKKN